jgi:hypothetical protein
MTFQARVLGEGEYENQASVRFTGPDPKYWFEAASNVTTLIPTVSEGRVRLWPNPSTDGRVVISVPLTEPAQVRVRVFTVEGDLLWTGQFQGRQGDNELIWDGVNRAREAVASGLYLIAVDIQRGSEHEVQTLRVVILR